MHALIQEAEPVYLLAHGKPVRMLPSVSDGDIIGQNKQKAKKDFIKKRPVSDVPAGKKPIDGLPPAGMKKRGELKKMGPLKVAALNGLTLSRLPLHEGGEEKPETSNHERCKELQQRMEQGMVFQEYEQVAKRRPAGDCSIAQLPESGERNRFQDVLPYDDTRVELVPSKENNTGYINASHIRMLDIPTVLNMLRQQRMMMVQTISQYSFIYKVLIQFLRNSRLI